MIEIVTGPDLHSADDTVAFVQELYLMLKRLGTCDGKLAEGKFRVDVNISLKTAEGKLGNRIEVKNISGFSTIHQVVGQFCFVMVRFIQYVPLNYFKQVIFQVIFFMSCSSNNKCYKLLKILSN